MLGTRSSDQLSVPIKGGESAEGLNGSARSVALLVQQDCVVRLSESLLG